MTRLFCLFLALAIILPHAAWAKNAEIMMLPTRVVMEKNDRYSTVVIKNTGDATGDFNIDLVDMKMEETGMVVPYAAGETPQYSAIPYIHIAPKSVTLKPGESQNVRLLLRKPEGMEAGEYRSHVKVRLVNDNADEPKAAPNKDAAISVKANLVIVIPVIVRNGDTKLTMGIDQAKLSHDKDGKPTVDMYLTRDGNQSSMGDISVTCSEGGAPKVIKFFPGVSVYRPTARRFISVPLDETPKDVNLSACKLGVVYAAQQKEGGGKLAETTISRQ